MDSIQQINSGASFFDMVQTSIDTISERYPFVSVISLGESIRGRRIPMVSIGSAEKVILYVGGIGANERATTEVLIRFLSDCCERFVNAGKIYNCSLKYLLSRASVHIVPLLNPDGIDLIQNGISENEVTYEYHLSRHMSNVWCGNAAGVDLKNNFCDGSENLLSFPCEPESGALRNYILFNKGIEAVIELARGEDKVTYACSEKKIVRRDTLGEAIAGLASFEYTCSNESGSLAHFCADEPFIPCYRVSYGTEDHGDSFCDYMKLRRLLFMSLALI